MTLLKIKNTLRYRWVFESDPLPGVLDDCSPSVILMTTPEDEERVLWKRKFRAVVLGYGQGWTLKDAILNVVGII